MAQLETAVLQLMFLRTKEAGHHYIPSISALVPSSVLALHSSHSQNPGGRSFSALVVIPKAAGGLPVTLGVFKD